MAELRENTQELDERIQRRLKQSENPMSIVLAFRSRECQAVIPTLYSFDKSVSRLRWDAGLRIPMEEATELLEEALAFTRALSETTGELNGGSFYDLVGARYEDQTTKRILANKRNASVFFPKTEEGDKVARLLKNLDPNLFQRKSGSTDFGQTAEILKKVYEVMLSGFHRVTEKLCEITSIEYRPSKALSAFLDRAQGQKSPELEKE